MTDTPEVVMARAYDIDSWEGYGPERRAMLERRMASFRKDLRAVGFAVVSMGPTESEYDAAWQAVLGIEPRLKRKLSIHEFRQIIKAVRPAMLASAQEDRIA